MLLVQQCHVGHVTFMFMKLVAYKQINNDCCHNLKNSIFSFLKKENIG